MTRQLNCFSPGPTFGWVKPQSVRCFFEGTAALPHRTPEWLIDARAREVEANAKSIAWESVKVG